MINKLNKYDAQIKTNLFLTLNLFFQGIPTTLRYKDVVSQAIRNINLTRIEDFIQTFSDFHNRYLNDTNGVESEKYLLGQVNASIQGYPGSISVIEFEHSDWLQNSIIVRIDGADPTLRSELVILGAHQDSINTNGATLRAPGTKSFFRVKFYKDEICCKRESCFL